MTHRKVIVDQRVRNEARSKWEAGEPEKALDVLRLHLSQSWTSGSTLTLYSQYLISVRRSDAAYEFLCMALMSNPREFWSLEMLIEVCRIRHLRLTQVRHAVAGFPLGPDPSQESLRRMLMFSLMFPVTETLVWIYRVGDAVCRCAILLACEGRDLLPPETIEELLKDGGARPSAVEEREAQLIVALALGRNMEAIGILDSGDVETFSADGIRLAIRRELYRNHMKSARRLLAHYRTARPDDGWAELKSRELSDIAEPTNYQLAKAGFPFPERSLERSYEVGSKDCLYLLHNSLPYSAAGYATRTQGLLSELISQGWSMHPFTRPGYPFDTPSTGVESSSIAEFDWVGNVRYGRLANEPFQIPKSPLTAYVREYSELVMRKARELRAGVIHAASNHWNGLAAVTAGNSLGVPVVYEVRGLWEVTRASRNPGWSEGGQYRFISRMETDAAREATHVITLTEALKVELVDRGVPADKVTIVPNGVDTSRFRPLARDLLLADELGTQDRCVIGYVGSVLDYEGVDSLIRAAKVLREHRDDFMVVIVGDGAELAEIEELTDELDLCGTVRIVGRVPHSEVERYYSIIDIMVYPRVPLPVCEMVSPMKPFEAMSMGKAVLGSTVGAIAEFMVEGVNGLTFEKGSLDDLVEKLSLLIDHPELVRSLSASSREWVVRNRSWERVSARVGTIYEQLGLSRL